MTDKALAAASKAREIAEAGLSKAKSVGAIHALGAIYQQAGEVARAAELYRQALDELPEHGGDAETLNRIGALNNLGGCLAEMGSIDEALVLQEQGLSLAEAVDAPVYVAQLASNVADLNFRSGKLSAALEHGDVHYRGRHPLEQRSERGYAVALRESRDLRSGG